MQPFRIPGPLSRFAGGPLLAALVMGFALAAATGVQDEPSVMDAVTAHRKAGTGEITLVDIRTPAEWRETGVPASAHTVTLDQQPKALLGKLDALLGGDKSRPLALICRTGNRSSMLASELRKVGYTNVIDVAEGIAGGRNGQGWSKAGLPLRKGADIANPPVVAPAVTDNRQ